MVSKACFELKSNIRNWSDQIIEFCPEGFNGVIIKISGTKCEIIVEGKDEEGNYDYIVDIWELLTWQDGYFYRPVSYEIDGKQKSVDELLSVNCRSTDEKWVSSAILLCRNNRQISEEIVSKYRKIRYKGRKEQSMNASMFSAYFYLISEAYAKINLEHRLVLLMHICDGFAIQFLNGSEINNGGNINIILNRLDSRKYKKGANMLGIDKSKAMNVLGYTRNELTHYSYKEDSLGSYMERPDTDTDRMINLYAFYVLEVALRVAVLEELGIAVNDAIKEYVMDEQLDWIKLEKHVNENCVLPMNVLRQMLQRIQYAEEKD